MADRGDTHYFVPKLNTWFAVASLAFLVTIVWMVIDDWKAEWKDYQRAFRELDLEKAREALVTLEEEGLRDRREELLARVEEAGRSLSARRRELREAEGALYVAKEERFEAEQAAKSLKGDFGMARYEYEEALLGGKASAKELAEAKAELDGMAARIEELDFAFARATERRDERQAVYDELRAEQLEAERVLAVETRELDMVAQRIETLDPTGMAERLANHLRDFPGLDFVDPNLKVQKYVLSNLTFPLNFTKTPRIDMCTTCHMGMEREGFEDEEHPHATHPRLDLFLSANSPHPVKEVGCTVCHRGAGEALSFQHADHRPSDAAEAQEWYEEHHWHKQHHWDFPMLSSEHIEASCVQCHQSSMELIAEEAPKLTEGYRLFERFGCYACHKVEWFPTKRRPGPSLTNLAAKLDPDFVDAWIAAPKAFRPTTWMPQVFHLENYAEEEAVVPASDWGQGPPVLGKQWNETAVASVVSYLFANHPERELPPTPVQGAADRGRELFNLNCLACHNLAPYEGDDTPFERFANPQPYQAGRYNTKGPNLRGVATKVDRSWLYHWVKDPQAWWSETTMPNLRLSDQEAADITAYVMEDPDGFFREVPEGWEEGRSPVDLEALREQARWFYGKLGRAEITRRLEGEVEGHRWDRQEVLETVVGEAWVRNQGCYSCHEISGLEYEMPIGTELTNWASKTVDKLDFGVAYRDELGQLEFERAGVHWELPLLDHYYHEGWLERKIKHPRSYDVGKLKNPKEKLRMPWFDFEDEQVSAIATFVMGLVDDEVERAKMQPNGEQLAMDHGLRVIRQKNCVSCHVVEPGQVTYHTPDRGIVTVEAELLPFPEDLRPPRMVDLPTLRADLERWAEVMEEEVPDEVGFRLLAAHGDVGGPAENVFVPLEDVREIRPPVGGDFVRNVTGYYLLGASIPNPEHDPADEESYPDDLVTLGFDEESGLNLIEDVDGRLRAYGEEEYDKVRWTFAPPVLVDEGHKVQREWFHAFLEDPVAIRRQMRVRMPSFHFEPGEAGAVADYFAFQAHRDWYARYAHTMRLVLGRGLRPELEDAATHRWPLESKDTWPIAAHMKGGGPGVTRQEVVEGSGLRATNLGGIEEGNRIATRASFAELFEWGSESGFRMVGPVSTGYEAVERRKPSYHPEIQLGFEIGDLGVKCYECHFGAERRPTQLDAPIAWAPDLQWTPERLREDYVWEWLWSPRLIYPGTAMAENFAADQPQYQDIWPDSTNAEQIRAVMDWLFNYEKSPSTSQ